MSFFAVRLGQHEPPKPLQATEATPDRLRRVTVGPILGVPPRLRWPSAPLVVRCRFEKPKTWQLICLIEFAELDAHNSELSNGEGEHNLSRWLRELA